MSNSIFEALFYGRISPWERKRTFSQERKELEQKIIGEQQYFKENMSADDYKRFEALKNLYMQATGDEEVKSFTHGFTLGALIMLEVAKNKGEFINE